MLILWLALACADAPVEPPPAPVVPMALEDAVTATLREIGEAVAYDRGGRREEAVRAWEASYSIFEKHLEDGLRKHNDESTTKIEYLFGRVRAELGQRRGRPERPQAELEAALEEALAGLSTAP